MPAQLTWTPSDSGITEIKSYSIFRNVDAGDYALLIECAVLRDMFGGIIGVQGCTTNHSPNDDTGQVREKFIEDAPVTYVDSTVLPGHAYCYYVQGNPLGNTDYTGSGPPSPPSNIGCVTVLAQATPPVLAGQIVAADIVLTWTAATVVGSTISGYEVHRNVDGGAFSLLTTVGNVLTYTDLAPASGHTYGYYVIAIPVVGINSDPSNTVFETLSGGCTQHLIQAGATGLTPPGASGLEGPFVGWFGTNDGNAGPGFVGATVSGQGLFLPGGTYGYMDGIGASRIPFAGSYFMVYSGDAENLFAFDTVAINGHTYSTSSVPYFYNGGGCGPTYWIWENQPAGLVDGQQYCVVWNLGT